MKVIQNLNTNTIKFIEPLKKLRDETSTLTNTQSYFFGPKIQWDRKNCVPIILCNKHLPIVK